MRFNQANLITENGGCIYLPPWYSGQEGWGNVARPDVYVASLGQQWPCGTIYREGTRTFIMARMGSSNDSAYRNAGYLLRTKATYKKVSNGMQVAAVDAKQITVNYGASCVLDKYSGGTFGVYGTSYGSRYIVKQYLAGESPLSGNDMYLDLDAGFPVAMATGDNITLLENRYKDVNAYVTDEFAPYVGVIMHHSITALEYSWLQCGGEYGMVFYWGGPTGDAASGTILYGYHGAFQAHETRAYGGTDGVNDTIGGILGAASQAVGIQAGYTESDMDGGMQVFLTILN